MRVTNTEATRIQSAVKIGLGCVVALFSSQLGSKNVKDQFSLLGNLFLTSVSMLRVMIIVIYFRDLFEILSQVHGTFSFCERKVTNCYNNKLGH